MASVFRYDGAVRSVRGEAIPGASIAVLSQPAVTTTQPGSPLVSIFAAAITNAAALSGASWLAGVVSFVFSAALPADVVVGSYVQITASNPAGYSGVFKVTGVTQGTNTITAALAVNPGAYVSGGTVATSALPNPLTSDNQGNFFFYAPAATYTLQIYDALGRIPAQLLLSDQGIVAGGAGAGSVTSVGLVMPAEFTVSGSPVVGNSTLTVTKANAATNTVYAGPGSGGAAAPAFRALVTADLPAGTGTVTSVALTMTVPVALMTAAVVGSPITTNGTLAVTLTLANQNANLVFAGPSSGGPANPTFRSLVPADFPGTLLQQVSVALSSANLLALLGTPITLVAAPGVGFAIVPISILIKFFGGAAAYTDAGGAVQFVIGTMIAALASNAEFLVTVTPNKRLQVFPWPGATDTAGNPPTDDNAPLQISKLTNNFAAGNGTAAIIVTYLIQSTT